MSEPSSKFRVMTNVTFPKTPAQVYRETTADIVAYNFGIALRVIWEVTKPIIKWTAIIAVLSFVGMIYLIWQLIFGTMKK
jgi:hypothetical protein